MYHPAGAPGKGARLPRLAGAREFARVPCFPALVEDVRHLDELAALDTHRRGVDVVGALALGAVHQRVGAVDQLRGELARHAAALGDRSELQADDADVDPHRAGGEAAIVARPVVRLDRLLEAIGNLERLVAAGQVRDQEAELVAAEPGVQVARLAAALQRQEVLGADLIGQDARDPLDDAVAGRSGRACRCTT